MQLSQKSASFTVPCVACRFRTLRLTKDRIIQDIVKPRGAMPCLIAAGWMQESDELLRLPLDADVEQVLTAHPVTL